jgi:hypothetical protein
MAALEEAKAKSGAKGEGEQQIPRRLNSGLCRDDTVQAKAKAAALRKAGRV